MEVMYYNKSEEGVQVLDGYSADFFYIPLRNVLLLRQVFPDIYKLIENESSLSEARALYEGKDPYEGRREKDGVKFFDVPEYSGVQKFQYDDEKINELIEDARAKLGFEKKVKYGIEELLRNARVDQ